ncbi:MAG: PfkB family carbohydrate kinase [Alphaproteobacteria bacterium]
MILVFGSVNLDLSFPLARLPQPGETVLGDDYVMAPGGKGANQALAASRAGAADVRLVAAVGRDDFATAALAGVRGAGVDLAAVVRTQSPTGCAAIAVAASGENAIMVASGANRDLRAGHVPAAWYSADATLLLQMEITAGESTAVARRIHDAGGRVILNLAPAMPPPAGLLAASDVLLVNRIEAAMAMGVAENARPPADLARDLAAAHGLEVIITLGGDGLVGVDGHGVFSMAALPVRPVDPTGAGDCFAGVRAAALDGGLDLREAARRAGVAGALACLGLGAQSAMPRASEIERHMAAAPEVIAAG